jgi:hypothetical protein
MNVREKLNRIKTYYDVTRQAGHTVGMLNGVVNTKKCIVLLHHNCMKSAIEFMVKKKNPKNVTFQTINSPYFLIGTNRPLFVDNAALWQLCGDAVKEIDRLTEENKRLKARQ